jgi:hypothetical protein
MRRQHGLVRVVRVRKTHMDQNRRREYALANPRRSYRDGGTVCNETVANLSMLPAEAARSARPHCPWAARLRHVAGAAVPVGAAPGGQGDGEVIAPAIAMVGVMAARCRWGGRLPRAALVIVEQKRPGWKRTAGSFFSVVVVPDTTRSEQVSIPPPRITVANATPWRAVNADRPGAEQNERRRRAGCSTTRSKRVGVLTAAGQANPPLRHCRRSGRDGSTVMTDHA